MKIVVDAMGGDYAPDEVIKGAYLASKELSGVEMVLAGREDVIRKVLEKEIPGFHPEIADASQTIEMGESPALAIRRKRKSSIVTGLNLLKDKKADAFVSCGNTGAMVCGSTIDLGLIKGVERPGIAILFPTLKGVSFIIDVGANIDPKPKHLMQYALMADVYVRNVLGRVNPSIGLLNIGEEETKGPDFLKETATLLKDKLDNFAGNIEAKDIFTGKCDCIISDGLAGNIALKVSEGFVGALGKFLVSAVNRGFWSRVGLFLIRNNFDRFKKIVDYAEYGGAPLLGVDGVVIIGHGRSKAKAVKNAVRAACRELERDINQKIREKINA